MPLNLKLIVVVVSKKIAIRMSALLDNKIINDAGYGTSDLGVQFKKYLV